MKNSNILNVVSVSEVRKDKNNRIYKTITFATTDKKEITTTDGSKLFAKVQPKFGKINVWEKSYLDNNQQFGFDFEMGDVVLGDVITQKVEPYEINNNKTGEVVTVNMFSCVVLGDSASSSWDSSVTKAFTSNDKVIELNLVDVTANVKVEAVL